MQKIFLIVRSFDKKLQYMELYARFKDNALVSRKKGAILRN